MSDKWTWSDDIQWAIESEVATGVVHDGVTDEVMRSRLRILRVGYGVNLATVVASDALTFDVLVAHGLPRGDQFAELAMLYRRDCPAEFFRASQFYGQVVRCPNLPIEVARTLLAHRPTALEVNRLAGRLDSASLDGLL